MKFITLFVVAVLAYNVAATPYVKDQRDMNTKYTTEGPNTMKPYKPYQFAELFEYVFEAFVEFLPQPFVNFMQFFYDAFQRFGDYFPADVKNAFYKMLQAMPSFQEFYTAEFHNAVAEFCHAFKNFFTSHQFSEFLNNFFQAFPSFDEFFPADFYATIAKHLEHVPAATQFLQQCAAVLKHLVAHTQHANHQ